MIYLPRFKANIAWLALMFLFALIIVRPDVDGLKHVALLTGWVALVVAMALELVLLSECMTADIGKDPAKRTKAIDFLRKVNANLAEVGKFRRIRGDVKLYLLAILISFTGHVFLALMFIVVRLLRIAGEYTAARVVENYNTKPGTPTPTTDAAQ